MGGSRLTDLSGDAYDLAFAPNSPGKIILARAAHRTSLHRAALP